MIRKKLLINGNVQGVGFRFFCQLAAAQIGNLTGYVQNLDNGDVLIEIQGDPELISLFINKIYKGNKFCLVNNIFIQDISIQNDEKNFKVIY